MAAKTPIANNLPIIGTADGEIISGKPKIVNYSQEILRNPLDSTDSTTRSAISLLPDDIRFLIETQVSRHKALFALSERPLVSKIESMGHIISATENLLRNKFWLEYDHTIMSGFERMRIDEVLRGVCSYKFFKETFLAAGHLVAYMLLPPINFKVKQEETLLHGLDRLRSILDLPTRKPNGDVDMNVVKAQMSVYQILERRVQGEVIQKTMNAHALMPFVPPTPSGAVEDVHTFTEERLVQELQSLMDKQKKRATNEAAVKDIFITEGRKVGGDGDKS